jgi:hypothetical protein
MKMKKDLVVANNKNNKKEKVPGPRDIKLSTGVVLKARTPKVKDMKLIKDIENDIDRETMLIGNLCQLSPEEVDELDMEDYVLLQKELLL